MSGPETAALITFVITAGITITRVATAFFNRHRPDARAERTVNADVEERLARIEQAIEAIAVEVERVSEGQRFTTRLLAGGANDVTRGAESVRAGEMSHAR